MSNSRQLTDIDASPLDRYRAIIDDWDAFIAALRRPLPNCIWSNTLRIASESLRELLSREGFDAEPLASCPDAFRTPTGFRPGRHWGFHAGLYRVQDAASMLPVALLDPKPGERVLDLCAAPGGKTAQIAIRMNNSGTLVANDLNIRRLQLVHQTLERFGIVNVSTTNCDGSNYPPAAGQFDRILVDAPCSCEGTARRQPGILDRVGPHVSARMSGVQRALLKKAVQLCRAGGRIVYATCTFAPEENEAVVDAVLNEYGADVVSVVPARVDGFRWSPALTEWQSRRFDDAMRHALRVWPHQNDSGGFFVAVLEKMNHVDDPEGVAAADAQRRTTDDPAARRWFDEFVQRFNIDPNQFENIRFFESTNGVSMVDTGHRMPVEPQLEKPGLFFMQTGVDYPKPTMGAAIVFGAAADANVIDLSEPQRDAYLGRRTFDVVAEQIESYTDKGYIIARYRGAVLGIAIFLPAAEGRGARVRSLFPKSWARLYQNR